MSAPRLAILEDSPELSKQVDELLRRAGYATALFGTAGRFLDAIGRAAPALAVVEMRLCGVKGVEVVRILRADPQFASIPVVAVSSQQSPTAEVVKTLEIGADEFLSYPFDEELFLARVGALLRRGGPFTPGERPLRLGSLTIYPAARSVVKDGEEARLTRLEFELLLYLIRNPNRALTRGLILQEVWKGDPTMETRTVDKHVESLRRKAGLTKEQLTSVIGVGYMLRTA